jgi:hypothetical protein
MAIDYTALATEINNDPSALGYAVPKNAGNDQGVADVINLVRAGASFQVNREPIARETFIENINSTEFAALTALQLSRLQVILTGATVDINGTNTQSNLLGIFPNSNVAGTTKSNISALLKRQASRAEVLFGRGTIVSATDVSRALRGAS